MKGSLFLPATFAMGLMGFACGFIIGATYLAHSKAKSDAPANEAAKDAPPPGYKILGEPKGDRFQIIQSPFMARLTFKLDTYTGDVWQLVVDKRDTVSWEPVPVMLRAEVESADGPRFQVFLFSLLARNTFLADLQTGQTWVLVSTKGSGVQWNLMASAPQ